ncbi:MAG TPA: biotin--[acetyl-CoA-carboxylase] ligase, partial [Thermoanaerobaculia bacterium]|nr:biotin--[acetyl-CoA-carboxylase] ligase [Thermoanaerobaculia bacterium]
MNLDTRRIVDRLTTIESLAVIPRVASTNLVARRIVNECIENELSLPNAMIVAEEQFAGRGRNERKWSSPAGKGIYATTLLTRSAKDMTLVPLETANIVASYLREVFGIDARIKWPNDILA